MADASRIARTHDHLRPQSKPAKRSRLSREDATRALKHLPKEAVDRLTDDPEAAEAFFGQVEAGLKTHAPPMDREGLVLDRIERRLTRIDRREQEARVQTAHAAHRATVEAVEAHDAMIHRIRDELRDAEAKLTATVNTSKADAAAAMLAGKPAPDNSAGRRKVERLGEKIAAAEAALDQAAPKRDALVSAERAAHAALCDETNDLICAGAQADMQAARKQLAKLAPTLASLWARDIVREKLVGRNWSFDHSRVRPMSGVMVVKNFLAGIAEDLRAPELQEAALEAAAEALVEQQAIERQAIDKMEKAQ